MVHSFISMYSVVLSCDSLKALQVSSFLIHANNNFVVRGRPASGWSISNKLLPTLGIYFRLKCNQLLRVKREVHALIDHRPKVFTRSRVSSLHAQQAARTRPPYLQSHTCYILDSIPPRWPVPCTVVNTWLRALLFPPRLARVYPTLSHPLLLHFRLSGIAHRH